MDDCIVKRLRSASHAFCSFIYDVLYPVTWCIKIIPFYAYGRILILLHVNYRERYRCGDIICVAHHDLDTTYRSQLSTKWMCCVLLSAKFHTYFIWSKAKAARRLIYLYVTCCTVLFASTTTKIEAIFSVGTMCCCTPTLMMLRAIRAHRMCCVVVKL